MDTVLLPALKSQNGTTSQVSIDPNSPGLRQVYQLAHSLGGDFKRIGARVMIVERYAQIMLNAQGGFPPAACSRVMFDFSHGREVNIVLISEPASFVVPYSQQIHDQVVARGEDCLWCGMTCTVACSCRKPDPATHFNAPATASD